MVRYEVSNGQLRKDFRPAVKLDDTIFANGRFNSEAGY